MKKIFAIVEIGSTNTKCHIYEDTFLKKEKSITIEFKKNYQIYNRIIEKDLDKLYTFIEEIQKLTKNIYLFGCSIFRTISKEELEEINYLLFAKYQLSIQVVSQKEEAFYTASGCCNIDYNKTICIFIGGGGSTELLFVKNKEIIDQKYFEFGVGDITKKFPSLKEDFNRCSFDEVYQYVDSLIGDINQKVDVLILAGGDHIYWYQNAKYELRKNTLYESDNQPFLIPIDLSDEYDKNAYETSLEKIRKHSDNPLWFDGSRAMKAITNVISHKVSAKYIIPTKINMEDGIKNFILEGKL